MNLLTLSNNELQLINGGGDGWVNLWGGLATGAAGAAGAYYGEQGAVIGLTLGGLPGAIVGGATAGLIGYAGAKVIGL